MSQFRIKQIDLGLVDDWINRVNDDGADLGDDIVAEDPNDLAAAIQDTQQELLKASVYAPSDLLDSASGLFERVKLLEDTFGDTTLQDAYNNGNFINLTPGRNLILGGGGVIEIDPLNNVIFRPNNMQIISGPQSLNLAYDGIRSTTTNLTFGTTGTTRDTTLIAGRDTFLKDGNLNNPVRLSETGVNSLITSSQSIVGAINEVSNVFNTVNLQQVYNQSSPPRITTSQSSGPFEIFNGSGSSSTPALRTQGSVRVNGDMKSDTISVGVGSAVTLTVAPNGNINTPGNIRTTDRVITRDVESEIGALTLSDTFGEADLTSFDDQNLNTTKQTIFGAINELHQVSQQNTATTGAFAAQHNSATGQHGIITTQSSSSANNSQNRFTVRNAAGADTFFIDGNGQATAQNLLLQAYNLLSELQSNEAHRQGSGMDHSAVADHIADPNPHDTVKSVAAEGQAGVSGDIVLIPGGGIGIAQDGNDITISSVATASLQGVYDGSPNGDIVTASGKNLNILNEQSFPLLQFTQDDSRFLSDIVMDGANITAVSTLNLLAPQFLNIEADAGVVDISSGGGGTVIDGVDFSSDGDGSILDFLQPDLLGAFERGELDKYDHYYREDLQGNNELILGRVNSSEKTLTKGTAVNIVVEDEDKPLWTPISEINFDISSASYADWYGVLDEDVAPGETGRVKLSGIIEEVYIGQVEQGQFEIGDTLYICRGNRSTVKIEDISQLSNGDSITFDSGGANLTYTAGSFASLGDGSFNIEASGNINIRTERTIQELGFEINDRQHQQGSGLSIQALFGGEKAKAVVRLTGAGTVGDTFTITPHPDIDPDADYNETVLTAVAYGNKTQSTEYEIGFSKEHTAANLAKTVNETFNPGHFHNAVAYGDVVVIEFYIPSYVANLNTLATTSSDIEIESQFEGGELELRVYTIDRTETGLTCSTSNAAAMSITDFTDNENGESQYMRAEEILDRARSSSELDKFIKVARVLDIIEADDPQSAQPFLATIALER